jgi:hypothetical protein
MNHSINYAGFIDLAISSETDKSTTASGCESENCKAAQAVMLLDDGGDIDLPMTEAGSPIAKMQI